MTRTAHHPHPTPAFPVYCLDWADDDTLLLGGGGGASRSGIENKLKTCKVSKDARKVRYINELNLSNEEDAPMTLAVDRASENLVTGINGSSSSVQAGRNDHCRVYTYGDERLAFVRGRKTIDAAWSDDYPYQKLTAISPSSELVAVGTTDNKVSLLYFPDLEPAVPTFGVDAELVDLDWGGEKGEWVGLSASMPPFLSDTKVQLAVTTTASLLLYHVVLDTPIKLDLKQTIYPPTLDITPVAFRSVRFSPTHMSPPTLHAVLNASQVRKRGAPRRGFVCTFGLVAGPSHAPITTAEKEGKGKEKEPNEPEELGKWDVLVRREVAGKPVTVFDISADGKLLAYGCSDLSIGILDAKTLAPLLKILAAHSFPPTALKFNPSATLLVSASADNTIRAIVVPARFDGVSLSLIAALVAILMVILALILRR